MIGGSKVSIRDRNKMRAMRAQGLPLSHIMLSYGYSERTILRHVADVPPPPHGWAKGGRPRKVDGVKAAQLRAQGFLLREVAERYGTTIQSVRRAILRSQAKGEKAPSLIPAE